MANEAQLYFETEPPIPMTCTDGTGIEKGALLTLSDPLTAALVTQSRAATAGVAREEKIASDGKTKVPVYRKGYFIFTASGAITVGEAFQFTNSNKVETLSVNDEHYAGFALETAADGETFVGELNPGHLNLA